MIETGTARKAPRAMKAPAMKALAMLTAMALAAAGGGPVIERASAQARPTPGLPIIRDTEIEQLLRDYAAPILHAAGLTKQNIRVTVLNDQSINAFVMDGRHIFINAGTLFESKTPNEIIGVLAHETGHLAGGHLVRLREKLAQAQTQSIIALLAGVGAMVAGARSGGHADIGPGAIFAPQVTIQRSLLAYVRTQEDQADHAGVKFLTATHQSARGMLELFKRLSDENLFGLSRADPYLQSHPLPPDRIAAIEVLAKASPYWDVKDSTELQLRHDLMRAKLSGFLERPETVARRYPASDHSLPALYARAISTYRFHDLRQAVTQIDALIDAQPGNPYFHELKGQALLEGGHAGEAIAPLRRAAQLASDPTLIQIMLAQALIATNNVKSSEEAIGLLRGAIRREPETPDAYAQLAMAYGRKGDTANADLAAAQAAFNRGDTKTARQLAARAKSGFHVGSPAWVQADDIVSLKPSAKNN
jgi:predicted Zn-dependent protease